MPIDKKLHPSVEIAEGLVIPEQAWYLHGNVLTEGMKNHKIIITGFPSFPDGSLGIQIHVYPSDEPAPMRFRES